MILRNKTNQEIRLDLIKLFPDQRESTSDNLRQCQLVMIRLLHILDYLCRHFGINYWIKDGTLLGAVRHKGFVPWDDDVDLAMTRRDYIQFVDKAVPCLPEDIFFQTNETDAFYPRRRSVTAKLRDRYSDYYEIRERKKLKWHMGLQVDISITDHFPGPLSKWFYNLPFVILVRSGIRRTHKELTKDRPLKSSWWYHNPANDYDRAFTYDDVFPLCEMKFEGRMVYCPNKWKDYLVMLYGDYNQLLPLEKRLPVMGEASAMTCCDHPASLVWAERENGLGY